ncbi:MAG: hypothetical protein EOO75_19815 [Myxococcales bacterium]|nr:MAG: hypothetical protein EOO75_19815 [Myxococcales bacterium]
MEDTSLFRQTMKLTAFLLGVSVLWVGTVTLSSVLVVTRVLPEAAPTVTTPATPGPKPASSDGPTRAGPDRAPAQRLTRRSCYRRHPPGG